MTHFSPLALEVGGVRDPKLGISRKPWGLLVHTTGGGVTAKAKRTKRTPISVAVEVYIASQNGSNGYQWGGPTYVCDHDGTLYQLAPDNVKTAHCGGGNRQAYIDGSWTSRASEAALAHWRQQWSPRYRHPYQLFPSMSPNNEYVGVEMIPVGDGFGGSPMEPGLRFTTRQHDAIIGLAKEIGVRYGWPDGWARTSRLVGHEDVDPLNRSDAGGGWDPGYLRAQQYFDFDYVRSSV